MAFPQHNPLKKKKWFVQRCFLKMVFLGGVLAASWPSGKFAHFVSGRSRFDTRST